MKRNHFYLILGIFILLIILPSISTTTSKAQTPVNNVINISVVLGKPQYDLTAIQLEKNTNYTIVFTLANDTIPHNLWIDIDSDLSGSTVTDPDDDLLIGPTNNNFSLGEEISWNITWNSGDEDREVAYYCGYTGHYEAGMEGRFVIGDGDETQTIRISVSGPTSFDITEVELEKDTTYTIIFTLAEDKASHNLRIDTNNDISESTLSDPEDILLGPKNDDFSPTNITTWMIIYKTPDEDTDVVYYCGFTGHYAAGMKGKFIIGKGGGGGLISLDNIINPILDNLNAISNNLWEGNTALFGFSAMAVFLVFGILLTIGIVYFAFKQKWNLTSLAIPLVLIFIFASIIVIAPLPKASEPLLPDEDVDAYIVINAMIKPWVFNITLTDGLNGNSRDCTIEDIIEKIKINPTRMTDDCNDHDASAYSSEGIEDYTGKVKFDKIVLSNFTGLDYIVLGITLTALDTEHGFIFPLEENPKGVIKSHSDDSVELTLAQHRPTTIFLNVPTTPAEYLIRCSFFCGAGHFGMVIPLIVL